jgi:hypothetical protein
MLFGLSLKYGAKFSPFEAKVRMEIDPLGSNVV